MLKQLLSDNRIFTAVVCLLVFIAGGLLYLQTVKQEASRDIQRTQEIVKQRYTPQTGEVAPPTAPGGHYHPDGMYHVGSHEAETPSATTPTNPQTGATPADITARIWTGKPLREVSSPDSLSPEERKARDAKIQKLIAEYKALKRVSQPLTTQAMKLNDETLLTIMPKQDAIRAEQAAVRADTSLSAEEKERLTADLDKQYDALMAVRDANREKSQALNEEAIRLVEKQSAILEELNVLRGKRRTSE